MQELGINSLRAALAKIREIIVAKGGSIEVKMEPKAVSMREDSELQATLERLALEQEEVDGDAPEDM